MKRRVARVDVPRPRAGGQWTEARYWSFIRSNLRLMFRKWPARSQALVSARRPYTGPNVRQKWEYRCADCNGWHMGKAVEVDHIHPCGTLRSFADVAVFVERLLCERDGFRVLCKPCHQKRTNGDTE